MGMLSYTMEAGHEQCVFVGHVHFRAWKVRQWWKSAQEAEQVVAVKKRQGATLVRPRKTMTLVLGMGEESRSLSGSESEEEVCQEKVTAEQMTLVATVTLFRRRMLNHQGLNMQQLIQEVRRDVMP